MRITGHSNSEHETCSINLLPEFLVNQIKAGEVIERPASLIKEVIENSLDADSTEIEVHIVENGLELISIKDNGKGMSYEELPYAFCRHATSKINNLDDLYNLSSFGFRGEALASISSISRLICKTAKNNGMGGKIIINGSKQETYHQVS
ncbi:MAG: DNA mismatch repair endonuclease MutL, partial [Bdellovibrionota bacterium]|nr:DNA mismatch repair endonuclease MutL [Bdellovibrionota bacterium]